jgi:ribosomal protein L13E
MPTSRRGGRGFSTGELSEIGLNVADARRLGLSVDVKRSSVHQWNVASLKTVLRAKKPKGKRKAQMEAGQEKP